MLVKLTPVWLFCHQWNHGNAKTNRDCFFVCSTFFPVTNIAVAKKFNCERQILYQMTFSSLILKAKFAKKP